MRLAQPNGLAALIAVAVLIVLYLYDRRRRRIPVGTLFLWEQVTSATDDRRRWRPDALFLLQLAVVLALVAACVQPILEAPPAADSGAPLVLVLDVSASMQTVERDDSRFEIARRRALARVDASDAAGDVMVVTAGSRPAVALPWTRDRARVRAALESVTALDSPGELAPAVALARSVAAERPGARVAVLTDLPPEASGVDADTRARCDWVQVGRTDDNVGVAGVTVTVPPFHGTREAGATIDVRNYGPTTREVRLDADVGGMPWARRTLTLAPRATEHVRLAAPPRAGVLEVHLATGDALAVDDRLAAWIPPGAPLDLLLVTDSRALADAFGEIAAALAGSRVEVTTRERFAAAPPAGRRIALLDGVVPASLPLAVNPLYVAPPAGNAVCPSGGRRSDVVAVDWDDDHPLLAGLGGLQALAVAGARELGDAGWGAPIVLGAARDAAFPLLVAGERNGRRTACLGAELGGSLASSDRVPLLLLTLATLSWLAEPFGPSALVVETGRPTVMGPGPTAPVRGDGLTIAGEPPVLTAERAGVFALGPAGAERVVLANLLDPRESDVGRRGAGEWAATRTDSPPTTAAIGGRPLAPWLAAAALALLALEWALWRRTVERGTAPTAPEAP